MTMRPKSHSIWANAGEFVLAAILSSLVNVGTLNIIAAQAGGGELLGVLLVGNVLLVGFFAFAKKNSVVAGLIVGLVPIPVVGVASVINAMRGLGHLGGP